MVRLLFLCTTNTDRSLMAQAFAAAQAQAGDVVESAGLAPAASPHPLAVAAMREAGLDIARGGARTLADLPLQEFDVVIALCPEAAVPRARLFPGQPCQVQWNIPDPAAEAGDEAARREAFRRCRDTIRRQVDDLFAGGYLQALAGAGSRSNLVLENLSEGVIAHDLERRIISFNSAAESITGFSRREVLGRDCHEVFPPAFCGGDCHFCDGPPPAFETLRYPVSIRTRAGERKEIEMSVRALRDEGGALCGVLASFRDLTREHGLARRLEQVESFSGILGRDKKMLEIFDLVRTVADSNVSVLVQGESGTGKELVAAAIHREGPRANRLFVPVNCGALPDGLLESELFGHVRGAFTGAIRDKKGRFEIADGGTLFLDEIGDVSPAMQVKLLRVLQEGTFERVGDSATVRVDARVISATNKDLRKEIAAGRFREDLYYRLCVVPITLPALRERPGDIPLLAEHLLRRAAADAGREAPTLSSATVDALLAYAWPGNVRELQNALQFALVKRRGPRVELNDLPPAILRGLPTCAAAPEASPRPEKKRGRKPKLAPAAVQTALDQAHGNKVAAARKLGVSRATLYRFLEQKTEE